MNEGGFFVVRHFSFLVPGAGISLLALRAAFSKPSVLNNFRHGGNPVALPPTHPSFDSKHINKKTQRKLGVFVYVPGERVELSRVSSHDFESCASAIPPPGR